MKEGGSVSGGKKDVLLLVFSISEPWQAKYDP